eukprot:sb/3473754/
MNLPANHNKVQEPPRAPKSGPNSRETKIKSAPESKETKFKSGIFWMGAWKPLRFFPRSASRARLKSFPLIGWSFERTKFQPIRVQDLSRASTICFSLISKMAVFVIFKHRHGSPSFISSLPYPIARNNIILLFGVAAFANAFFSRE